MPLRLSKHRVLLDGIPLNESQSVPLPSASTLDIWSVTGNVIPISGSATVSGFTPAPQPGTKRTLLCTGTPSFTHSTNLLLPGSADYTATAGDRIEVLAVTTTQFRLSIIKASVLPDVQFSKDASGNVTGLLGPDGTHTMLGRNVLTAGIGGRYSTINAAIAAHSSRYVPRTTYTGAAVPAISATFTNGSPNVTTTGTFDIQSSPVATGVPLNDFFTVIGRKYRIKYRTSATQVVLWENFVGTTGTYSVSYERIEKALVVVLPGNFTESVSMAAGVCLQGINRDVCVFSNDAAFAGGSRGGDNTISNITIGPTPGFLSLDNASSGAVEYAGATFTYDNILFRAINEGNSHAGGGLHLSTIPGGTVIFKNSEIELGDEPFDVVSFGEASRRSRVEILSTSIRLVAGHQSGGVSGGMPVQGFSDAFNATEYHDFYFSDVNIYSPDLARNTSFAGTYGSILASGVNNTWQLNNVISDVTNINASAASGERAGCVVVAGGVMRINNCNLKAGGSNISGASGIALDVSGGTVYIENTVLEGNQFAIRQTGGTIYIGKGVTINGPVSGTLSSEVRGVATLVAGTVTVNSTKVHAASRIKLCHQTAGGTVGILTLGTVTANTSFVINSSSATDTSAVLWELEH